MFQAAIAQSGSALCPWALRENELEAAQRIAQNLQCPTTPTHDLVSCLRDADIDQLIVESRLAVVRSIIELQLPKKTNLPRKQILILM